MQSITSFSLISVVGLRPFPGAFFIIHAIPKKFIGGKGKPTNGAGYKSTTFIYPLARCLPFKLTFGAFISS